MKVCRRGISSFVLVEERRRNNRETCFILCNKLLDKNSVEVDELPEYPEELYLAYEQTCNYRCPSCPVHSCLEYQKAHSSDLNRDYEIIEEKLW